MSAILTPIAATNYQAAGESHPRLTSLDWPLFCGVILLFPEKEMSTNLRRITIVTTTYTILHVRLLKGMIFIAS